jgi:hypothetical protein
LRFELLPLAFSSLDREVGVLNSIILPQPNLTVQHRIVP